MMDMVRIRSCGIWPRPLGPLTTSRIVLRQHCGGCRHSCAGDDAPSSRCRDICWVVLWLGLLVGGRRILIIESRPLGTPYHTHRPRHTRRTLDAEEDWSSRPPVPLDDGGRHRPATARQGKGMVVCDTLIPAVGPLSQQGSQPAGPAARQLAMVASG